MSQPEQDIDAFWQTIFEGGLKQRYDNQLVHLQHNLKTAMDKQRILTYQLYEKDRKLFEQIFKKNIMKQYSSFQYKKESQIFQILIEVKDVSDIFEKITLHLCKAAVISAFIGIPGEAGVFGATTTGVLSAVGLPITLGVAGIGLLSYSLYKISKKYQECSFIIYERIREIENTFEKAFSGTIYFPYYCNTNCFTFENLPYIRNIQCFDKNGKEIKIEKIENDKKFRANLKMGKNKIRFTCKLPSIECYKKFLIEQSKIFYNKKE